MGQTRDAAFTDFLHARQPALLRIAWLLTGDLTEAEDILQTSLAKLYLAWDRVDDPHAFLRRVLTNETTSLWRRAWRRREVSASELPDGTISSPLYDDTQRLVWELVEGLAPRARAVVVLRYYEGLSESEIADTLGIAVGTVKSQASRALASLRARVPADLLEELS
ncbi:SigE family RNA polymerase sigma factor [Nocardioides sp. Kera G14]|uniref:SigE family RNA polymerase sigma factor n=1 Tax=Nocardioides sp. Kera G14 TaxID=2884264 RepID=UPI001D0F68BC|nr:SigE family RNA polymerase sigma factor [Nocardioides sp. Kera G14]UDY24317.1 SigE family RNA polymerase sigma factor [Nocardioides sp. Kera G14]